MNSQELQISVLKCGRKYTCTSSYLNYFWRCKGWADCKFHPTSYSQGKAVSQSISNIVAFFEYSQTGGQFYYQMDAFDRLT